MSRVYRKVKVVGAFVIVVLAGYALAIFWASRNQIPADFTTARLRGAVIAANIVNLSKQSTDQLAKINTLDQAGKYAEALTLTNDLITESEDLRNQAVDLSTQVGAMTQALSGVASFNAQQAALQSISSRLALINQLINYSGDLGKLLDVLQAKFNGVPQQKGIVQGLVNQINTDVNAINNFNSQSTQAMSQFDKIVGG